MFAENLTFSSKKLDLYKGFTVESLHDLFCEGALTMSRLPPAIRKQKLSFWVDFQQGWLAYADEATFVRIQPTNAQITRWEYAIELTSVLPLKDKKLVWLVAISAMRRRRGASWKKLSKLYNCDPRTVRRDYEEAIVRLYLKLQSL